MNLQEELYAFLIRVEEELIIVTSTIAPTQFGSLNWGWNWILEFDSNSMEIEYN